MKFRSEQSRALRHTIIRRTLLAWIVYTVAFVLLAITFNTFASPALGNAIADATSSWQLFSDEPYRHMTTAELRGKLKDQKEANKETVFFISSDDVISLGPKAELTLLGSPFIDAIVHQVDSSATGEIALDDIEAKARELLIEYTIEDAASPEEAILNAIEVTTENSEGSSSDTIELEEGSADDEDFALQGLMLTLKANGSMTVSPYTRQTLYADLLEGSFTNGTGLSSTWQRGMDLIDEGDGLSSHCFYARDLSVYYAIRDLKIPLIAVLYLIGTLAIMFIALNRSSRYFDALNSGIAHVFEDRSTPVTLPRELAIAQGELNNIRLQSLSDERAAQAAELRKNELVVYLAHDIRTPLTSIIGYLSLLVEAPDLPDETRKRYLTITEQKAERLEGLIEEFFEITKYNLQSIPIERRNIEARLFLEQLADEFYPQATAKDLKIRVSAPPDESFFVDPSKLARALGNIVRNALSYADHHTEVIIEAKRVPADSKGPSDTKAPSDEQWRIEVTDRGREIAEVHLESIFEKFYREDSSRTSSSGGTGLGLAIAKEIVVAHEGTIFAKSERGITTFTVTLPI